MQRRFIRSSLFQEIILVSFYIICHNDKNMSDCEYNSDENHCKGKIQFVFYFIQTGWLNDY